MCLFDLDQTLVDTDDMKDLREAGKHRTDQAYKREVQRALASRGRSFVAEIWIVMQQHLNPGMAIGIFTRSPRSYVEAVLAHYYPKVTWDVVIAYEDVDLYKPNGQGIERAMAAVGLRPNQASEVLLVGDSDVDVRAAYHAGCHVYISQEMWPRRKETMHWRSLNLLPDRCFESRMQWKREAIDPVPYLPDLECLLADPTKAPKAPRFDAVGKFYPNSRVPHPVYTAGRYFVQHAALEKRKSWHRLSQSILANKDAVAFPLEWIETIRRFIADHYKWITAMPVLFGKGPELLVTAIPARPGRPHRLGNLIAQLQASYGAAPKLNRLRLSFDPNVLAYRPGVQSQSHDHLNQDERMANVRNHLFVANTVAVRGKKVLVIDDVSTTGATLLYAKKYLEAAGARSVDMFSLAQTISDPLRH